MPQTKFFSSNLSGGMNTRTSTFVAKPTELILGRNIILDQIGSIRKRSGYGGGLTIQANKEILGLYEFVITTGSYKYLLAISNNSGDTNAVLKYSTDFLTFTTHPDTDCSALLANAKYEFTNFLDKCFIVGATDSAFQGIFTLSGILNGDYDSTSFVTGAPNAKYIIQSNNRIILANTSNNGSEYFWSDYPDPSTGALTWTSTNYNRISTNDGEQITGLSKNFNRVLLFKPSSIYKWDPDGGGDTGVIVKETGNIGCTSHRSIVNLGGITIFFKEGYGFYSYENQEPTLISRKIDDWIHAIVPGQDVCAFTDGTTYYASIGDITLNGRTYNNVGVEFNSVLESWTIRDNLDASVIATFGDTDTKSFYFGSSSTGKVYQLFSHTTTSTSSTSSSTSSTSHSTSSTSTTTTP
jgi:hypothetical protein